MMARKREVHRSERSGWLRAAVLGANDGILSTASLVLGVAASHAAHGNVMVAGVAGLVAGAMSMASGATFTAGAAVPLMVTALAPAAGLIYAVAGTSLLFLILLGGWAAYVGGASVKTGAMRVTFWGVLAMAVTTGVGALFGTVV